MADLGIVPHLFLLTEDTSASSTASRVDEVAVQPPTEASETRHTHTAAGPSGTATPATLVTVVTESVVQASKP